MNLSPNYSLLMGRAVSADPSESIPSVRDIRDRILPFPVLQDYRKVPVGKLLPLFIRKAAYALTLFGSL